MSNTTTKQYVSLSKILKADKDRVLAELDALKKEAINSLPQNTQKWISEQGFETVRNAAGKFFYVPDVVDYLQNRGFDIDLEGIVTIKTLKGEFNFPIDDIAEIEKRIKSQYPASVSKPAYPAQRMPSSDPPVSFLGADGKYPTKEQAIIKIDATIQMHEDNAEEALLAGNLKLQTIFEKEIDLLNKAKELAEKTNFEELELERFIKEDLIKNPILKRVPEEKLLEFGKKLIALNLLDYPIKEIKLLDVFEYTLDIIISIKRFRPDTPLDEIIKEKESLLMALEEEQKAKHWSERKGYWKVRNASQDRDFYGRRKNIDSTEKEIKLINESRELIEMAINNEPFQVRELKPQNSIVVSKKLKESVIKTDEVMKEEFKTPLNDMPVLTKTSFSDFLETKGYTKWYKSNRSIERYESIGSKRISEKEYATLEKEYADLNQPLSKPAIANVLRIDIETYSPVDLKKSGLYVYTEHPEFEILLFAYAFNNAPVIVIDLAMFEEIPANVLEALTDPSVLKTAFNANFERICISRSLGIELPIDQWECTMIKSAMVGLPFSLAVVGKVLKLDQEKMAEGKGLIRYFTMPCKPTKANGQRLRNLPEHDMDKWNTFKSYNRRDVEAEREISDKISFFNIPEGERELYVLDQIINDRGVMIDKEFVNNAIQMDATYKDKLTVETVDLTNLDNPNSVAQLKAWLSEETGEDVTSLTKEAILTMLKNTPSDEVAQVLKNRQEMAKTSVKKYQAMNDMAGAEGRIRGLAQFYGANRTGRWAGRGVQLQNLPQNHLHDLDLARQLVAENDLELLEMLFGNVPDTLSQLIRTAFVPKPGHTFLVADFSAIEARVIAWLADEKWRLDVFSTHGKIYEASASQMFKVPIESVVKGSALRQKGKVSELALGYQGGPGALTKMGALKMGIEEDELQELVNTWRAANPNIVELWKTVDNASKKAIKENTVIAIRHGVHFEGRGNVMYIKLPSGRRLSYWKPRFGTNKFGSDSIIYEGMNQTTKQWCDQETYGGKLVENCVQAIARDCLAFAMLNLEKVGYRIVFHVHDECIIEIEEDKANIMKVCEIMGQPIPWAKGLLLTADGYETKYYKK